MPVNLTVDDKIGIMKMFKNIICPLLIPELKTWYTFNS